MDWGAVLAWAGGIASTVMVLLLRAHIEARKEERRTRRTSSFMDRQRRIDTDRAIYQRRLTTLVRSNLAAYIRTGSWRVHEANLVQNLEHGAYEDFVDPEVNAAWLLLIAKSVELARKRKAGTIGPADIEDYNVVYRSWEDAAHRSFGPLPETGHAEHGNQSERSDVA